MHKYTEVFDIDVIFFSQQVCLHGKDTFSFEAQYKEPVINVL